MVDEEDQINDTVDDSDGIDKQIQDETIMNTLMNKFAGKVKLDSEESS